MRDRSVLPSFAFVLLATVAACAHVDTKEDYARKHRFDRCLHACAEGEMCNFGYPGDPCLPLGASKRGEPCSDPENCAAGLICDTTAVPGHCSPPLP